MDTLTSKIFDKSKYKKFTPLLGIYCECLDSEVLSVNKVLDFQSNYTFNPVEGVSFMDAKNKKVMFTILNPFTTFHELGHIIDMCRGGHFPSAGIHWVDKQKGTNLNASVTKLIEEGIYPREYSTLKKEVEGTEIEGAEFVADLFALYFCDKILNTLEFESLSKGYTSIEKYLCTEKSLSKQFDKYWYSLFVNSLASSRKTLSEFNTEMSSAGSNLVNLMDLAL